MELSKSSHQHNRSAYSSEWENASRCTGGTIIWRKHYGTPDTTLTSLLRQESTITCCDRFDRNCQYIQHKTSSNQMRFVHFADDTRVVASNSDTNNVHSTVNRELVFTAHYWLKINRISLNVSKISYMIICNQKNAFNVKIEQSLLIIP